LNSEEEVAQAYAEMERRIRSSQPNAKIDGVLVQPMSSGGRELILGARQDKQFGPVILLGLGGIFVEVFEQATMRIAPLSKSEAEAMITEFSGSQILMGVRGEKPYDTEAAVDAILKLSQLMIDFPQIEELDINPLTIYHKGQGCFALDARIIPKR